MIDPEKLPKVCLVDTNVWLRALGHKADDRSRECQTFYEAMLENGGEMLLAAPTLAELVRGEAGFQVPSTTSIRIVAFDRQAAQLLGLKFPMSVLKRLSVSEAGAALSYLKYDAMIAACALRWGAPTLVAYDDDHVRLARTVKELSVRKPSDFEAEQRGMPWAVPAKKPRRKGKV